MPSDSAAVQVPHLNPEDIAQILAFLETLRDDGAIAGRLGVPASVPSGLPVDK